ncbi:MAG: ABC transporter substrate-binding protein [Burkholderiales bacterium]|nr:ABC transporter substrate-binding protein [Burkholderiales bacterium]
MKDSTHLTRRQIISAGAAATGIAGAGAFLSMEALAQDKAKVNMQLGWIAGGNQIAEVAAKRLGYYEQEGIDFAIQPGGPSIDGVAIVASGRWEVGQVSSSPSNMLAVSQDLPIKVFATGLQQHPYTFFSLKKNPIRTAQDMIGKKVGIQSTGIILLKALLAKNKIDEKLVTIIPIGADMAPLMTGQVDTVTGWQTNTSALKVLGPDRVDLRLWDAGVRLYALPYYAPIQMIEKRPDVLQRFLRATARGWAYANKNRDAATDLLIKEYPNLDRADERAAIDSLMSYAYNPQTQANGWGAMDRAVWQDQITQYADLGQFSKRVPKVDEVMTMDILNATRDYRLKNM